MDFGEVKVRERQRNAGPCGRFSVQEPKERVRVRGGSMMAKISLCLGMLLVALVLELGGVTAGRQQQVFAGEEPEPTDGRGDAALGALYYVEDNSQEGRGAEKQADEGVTVQKAKWAPPVRAQEVTLLREEGVVGFCALDTEVTCCCEGKVFSVGEDEAWGRFVRVHCAGDIDTVYYGLEEIRVKAGQSVAAGQQLGTVPRGRQVYLSVAEKGAPQDPRTYVDLTVEKRA